MRLATTATCPECEREFDLLDEDDAEELAYGHDCCEPEDGFVQVLNTGEGYYL